MMRILAATVLVSLAGLTNARGAEIDCAPLKPIGGLDQQVEKNLKGQANILYRSLGAGEFEKGYKSVETDTLSKYPNADKLLIWRSALYFTCTFIASSKQWTDDQKWEKFMLLLDKNNGPPPSLAATSPEKGETHSPSNDRTGINWDFQSPTSVFDFDKSDKYGKITAFHFVGRNSSDRTLHRVQAYIKFERWHQVFPLYTLIDNQWVFPKEADTIPPGVQFIFGCSLRSQLSWSPPPCDQRPLTVPGDMGSFDFVFEADATSVEHAFSIPDIEKLIAKWDQETIR
jgi:hypothetical protein